MFTWICPQCGREVPPSYSECPTCAERRQQAAGGQAPTAAPPPQQPQAAPPQPQYTAPPPQQQPPQYAPQQQQYAPPPQQPPQYAPQPQQYTPPPQQQYAPRPQQQYAPPPQQPAAPVYTITEQKKGMPTWLVGVLTIAVLGGALFGLYRFVGGHGSSAATAASKAPASAADSKNPYAKYIEVVGLRLLENSAKKPIVRFAVINHSQADLSGLELRVHLNAVDAKADSEPISIIEAKVGDVPAYGTKDVEAPLDTKLKIYELPDWQFVRTTFEVTAPN